MGANESVGVGVIGQSSNSTEASFTIPSPFKNVINIFDNDCADSSPDMNFVMLGRQNDPIKGTVYAIRAMDLIRKEIPDVMLYLITSDSRIQFIKDLIKELKLEKNVKIIYHTYDISSYFYNSSILLYSSLSEAFPMALNEGKAHGMPIVAFDVPISNPYQSGIIPVESQNYEAMAKECVLLLRNYEYRRRMGEISKLSLNKFSNNETTQIWVKLFSSLNEGVEKFRALQKEIMDKYYNEETAKKHIDQHFRDMQRYNRDFTCYTLENFTNIHYIQKIEKCNVTKNLNNTNK